MNISIGKLLKQVEKTPEINEEDTLVRELLEICFLNKSSCKVEDLSKYNSRIFMKVYEEILKKDIEDKKIIKDMMSSEYLTENLKSTQQYIDDEDEIY